MKLQRRKVGMPVESRKKRDGTVGGEPPRELRKFRKGGRPRCAGRRKFEASRSAQVERKEWDRPRERGKIAGSK